MTSVKKEEGYFLIDALLLLFICLILAHFLLIGSQTMKQMEGQIIEEMEIFSGFYF